MMSLAMLVELCNKFAYSLCLDSTFNNLEIFVATDVSGCVDNTLRNNCLCYIDKSFQALQICNCYEQKTGKGGTASGVNTNCLSEVMEYVRYLVVDYFSSHARVVAW